jgi:hypothetical protein
MAGSRKWFVYTTDLGTNYALNVDESNVEDIMGTNGDYLPNTTIRDSVPGNLKVRRAVYARPDGSRSISIPVLTTTVFNAIPDDFPSIDDPLQTGTTLFLVRLEPERFKLIPSAVDTGLNDGDAT